MTAAQGLATSMQRLADSGQAPAFPDLGAARAGEAAQALQQSSVSAKASTAAARPKFKQGAMSILHTKFTFPSPEDSARPPPPGKLRSYAEEQQLLASRRLSKELECDESTAPSSPSEVTDEECCIMSIGEDEFCTPWAKMSNPVKGASCKSSAVPKHPSHPNALVLPAHAHALPALPAIWHPLHPLAFSAGVLGGPQAKARNLPGSAQAPAAPGQQQQQQKAAPYLRSRMSIKSEQVPHVPLGMVRPIIKREVEGFQPLGVTDASAGSSTVSPSGYQPQQMQQPVQQPMPFPPPMPIQPPPFGPLMMPAAQLGQQQQAQMQQVRLQAQLHQALQQQAVLPAHMQKQEQPAIDIATQALNLCGSMQQAHLQATQAMTSWVYQQSSRMEHLHMAAVRCLPPPPPPPLEIEFTGPTSRQSGGQRQVVACLLASAFHCIHASASA